MTPLAEIPAGAQVVGDDGMSRVAFRTPTYPRVAVEVLDLRTRQTSEVPLPRSGCEVGAGIGGLLATCIEGAPIRVYARGYDEGPWTPVALPGIYAGGSGIDGISPMGIGRRWVLLNIYGYHWQTTIQLDRRGTRTVEDPVTASGARSIPSLNARSGRRPLCSPLRRIAQPTTDEFDSSPWVPLTYAKPWAVEAVVNGSKPSSMRLYHCGGRARGVAICRGGGPQTCIGPSIFGDRLAWSDLEGAGYVRDLRTGRTTTVRDRLGFVSVRLVGPWVLVTKNHGNAAETTFGILDR